MGGGDTPEGRDRVLKGKEEKYEQMVKAASAGLPSRTVARASHAISSSMKARPRARKSGAGARAAGMGGAFTAVADDATAASFNPAVVRYLREDLGFRGTIVGDWYNMGAVEKFVAPIAKKHDLVVVPFGHIGDGNLHMNILKPAGLELAEFESRCHEISGRTYALTREIGGSISAEHGIGLLKRPWLDRVRSKDEIEFMRGIKRVFDPAGIFNPGKLL